MLFEQREWNEFHPKKKKENTNLNNQFVIISGPKMAAREKFIWLPL